jgi:hypothetical protein
MNPAETQNIRGIRAALVQQIAQIDALLNAPATPKHSPEVAARLELDAEADRIIGYWEGADRRRDAVALLICRGLIVRSPRPYRYQLAKEVPNA